MKLSLVSYLNTLPFIMGIDSEFTQKEVLVESMPPSACAVSLKKRQCDLALIPVGALSDFKKIELLNNYCIGSDGLVDSVFLFAQTPIEHINLIYEDPHSRSSNKLTRILVHHHWNTKVDWLPNPERNFSLATGNQAVVAIGDKAFEVKGDYAYCYDLSMEWKKMTGLPFVFAVWGYYPGDLTQSFVNRLEKSFRKGLKKRSVIAGMHAGKFGYTPVQANEYLTQRIQYEFGYLRHDALKLYLKLSNELTSAHPSFSAETSTL